MDSTRSPDPLFDDEVDLFVPSGVVVRASMPVAEPTYQAIVSIPPHVRGDNFDAAAEKDMKTSHKRLGDALPEKGWLTEFVQMALPMTSAPTEFHLAAGLTALASTLGNRIKDRNWGQNIYPNLYSLVVAPSSSWGKTTSMNMAEELLARSGLDTKLPDDFSRESLLEAVAAKPTGLLTAGEFASVLQTARKDFGAGILADLTGLYDGKDKWVRKLRKESFTVRRPAVSIYAATTIDWLQELVTPADLRSGLYFRFLFITATEKNTNRKHTGDHDKRVWNRLVTGLHRISRTAPDLKLEDDAEEAVRVTFSAEAQALWDAYLDELEKEGQSGSHPTYLLGFFNRYQTHALKLAMLYRASACAFDPSANPLLVDAASMKSAIAYLKMVWGNTAQLFEEEWAGDKEARELMRVEEAIGKGCSRTDALRRTHMKAWTFDQNLNTLLATGQIEKETRTTSALGLNRERVREIEWLTPGPNHRTKLAKKRHQPKEPWAEDWDRDAANEQPIVPGSAQREAA